MSLKDLRIWLDLIKFLDNNTEIFKDGSAPERPRLWTLTRQACFGQKRTWEIPEVCRLIGCFNSTLSTYIEQMRGIGIAIGTRGVYITSPRYPTESDLAILAALAPFSCDELSKHTNEELCEFFTTLYGAFENSVSIRPKLFKLFDGLRHFHSSTSHSSKCANAVGKFKQICNCPHSDDVIRSCCSICHGDVHSRNTRVYSSCCSESCTSS
ncbi:hypothetical protein 4 [Hubei picorna-like virus 75]|uniref:hypothetical protein 4 n=1 Tax=Hubei picorna-like virus 75 TaxID=1923159 RepID=UPI00090BA9CA|nr:hypothetical protein 4 [Hubei picorna-like virus 75]APG78369.1 hypothetical protein 4 [Hubei picorna-like virus 75]